MAISLGMQIGGANWCWPQPDMPINAGPDAQHAYELLEIKRYAVGGDHSQERIRQQGRRLARSRMMANVPMPR
jgi:hypothetical protein